MKRKILVALMLALTVPCAWSQPEEVVSKIYQMKWRSAQEIRGIVEGFRDHQTQLSISDSFNTLTVKSTEKNHTVIGELIRKYDIPAKTVEFQFYLIKATAAAEGMKDGLPEKIRKVMTEVAGLTRYKGFESVDAPVLRASEGKEAHLSGKGHYFYGIRVKGVRIVQSDTGKRQIRVDEFGVNFAIPTGFSEKQYLVRDIGVNTSFTIGDGETVVVGASQIREESKDQGAALITVVTARVID
jgi:hypothetical protein